MGINVFFLFLVGCLFPSGQLFSQDLVEFKLIDSISVSFDSGSSAIRNPSDLINRINRVKTVHTKIRLIAYTDTIGNKKYNQALASKRLLSVSKLIEASGLKTLLVDSVNQNEARNDSKLTDEVFRRVDMLIFTIEPRIKFNVPTNLRINFHSESDRIVSSSMKYVEALRMVMEIDSTLHIKLNGHVCCKPGPELSLSRAEKVKSYLVEKGIAPDRISCKGFSNDVKLVPEVSDDNKRRNMRVEVIFIK